MYTHILDTQRAPGPSWANQSPFWNFSSLYPKDLHSLVGKSMNTNAGAWETECSGIPCEDSLMEKRMIYRSEMRGRQTMS